MSRRYIDADNLKIVLICTEKELTIEDIVNYIDNNICNDAIPIERLEQIRTKVLAMSFSDDAEDINKIFDKAIEEQEYGKQEEIL